MAAYSKGMPVGTAAPTFSLPGVDGKTHSLASYADKPVLVVIFTCNHCPYAKAMEARFVAFQHEWGAKGVQVVAINSNDVLAYPDDSFEHMKARAAEQHFNFPYLFDESQAVARAYDAACTPDIFVFDAARTLRYNGRFDDSWQDPAQVTRQELARAVEAVLAGKNVDFDVVPSMGCSIKWKAAG